MKCHPQEVSKRNGMDYATPDLHIVPGQSTSRNHFSVITHSSVGERSAGLHRSHIALPRSLPQVYAKSTISGDQLSRSTLRGLEMCVPSPRCCRVSTNKVGMNAPLHSIGCTRT